MTTPGSFTERVAKAKSNYKGGQSSHLYDRVIYLKETKAQHERTYKEIIGKLKRDEWSCPMGWMASQVVTDRLGIADEIPA